MADYGKQLRDKVMADAVKQAAASKLKSDTLQSSYQQGEDIKSKYLQSVQNEADVAGQAVGGLQEAQREGLAATRAQAGKVLAASRGMMGGGRGVAMMRGASLDRSAAEGAQRASYADRIQEATQRAAQARSEALSEQGKALQAKQLEAQNTAAASTRAEEEARLLAQDYVGWLSDANRNEIAASLRAKADKQGTPGERQAWLEMADKVSSGLELGRIG